MRTDINSSVVDASDSSALRQPNSARNQLDKSNGSAFQFQFETHGEDEPGAGPNNQSVDLGYPLKRMNTEGAAAGNHSDVDDNLSMFSESIVEKEGITRNPQLVLPEADDDAFYEIQSQRSQSSTDRKNAILSKSKTFISIEEEKKKPGMTEVKFIDTMATRNQSSSQSMLVQNR